jgi:hypothetical protein
MHSQAGVTEGHRPLRQDSRVQRILSAEARDESAHPGTGSSAALVDMSWFTCALGVAAVLSCTGH